ncbi:ABC transporter ATP-binding protein, partial [Burkholderia cepacia]|uniref:ABC transporter ATP-binding protein n=1 Tax=Burkholderia cepacia TaxID=292 RepID=UPI00200A16AA
MSTIASAAPATPARAAPLVRIERLTIGFRGAHGTQPVVGPLDLAVHAGECVALVGESGSGKSTLLRALTGLVPLASGSLSIDGRPVGGTPDRAFRRHVQMVFQDPYASLHPRFTVDQTLREPLSIHGMSDTDARIARALSEVGLGPAFRFRYPHQLSGGQRQRAMIAMALACRPRLLLA